MIHTLALIAILLASLRHISLAHAPMRKSAHRFNTEYLNSFETFPQSAMPTSTDRQATNGTGLNLDKCITADDCKGTRTCRDFDDENGGSCPAPGGPSCRCVQLKGDDYCTFNSDCPEGEVCGGVDTAFPICISKAFADSRNLPYGYGPYGNGLTLDQCHDSKHCQDERTCKKAFTEDLSDDCDDTDLCVCVPPRRIDCSRGESCPIQETCGYYREVEAFCMSPRYIKRDRMTEIFTNDGYTLDSCEDSDSCRGSRICAFITDGTPCVERDECWCKQTEFKSCAKDKDCGIGEVCARRGRESPICASGRFVDSNEEWRSVSSTPPPQPSPKTTTVVTPGRLCIASSLLGHLKREELFYETDEFADVLCDLNGSCATAGHMVVWEGRGMMMERYCGMVRCVERVMKVNNPRYRRGMNVKTQTEGLEFSLFAAVYGTRAEEILLRTAMRMGL